MRILILALATVVLAIPITVDAGTFEGLEPGVSTRADAEAALGPPIREVVAGVRYDYDPSKYGARRISIQYDRQTALIVKIDLYLEESHSKSDYRGWFELGQPSATSSDDSGKLVERYLPQAISLHYAGPDDSSPVAFFRHFVPGPGSTAAPVQTSTATDHIPGASAKPFLGASFVADHGGQGVRIREVHPGSPADRAGLRPGDVILEFGEHSFYGGTQDPWEFVALIGAAPTGRPIRMLVERGTARVGLEITLELRDPQQIEAERRRLALDAYRQGDALGRQGKFAEAIPYLERAYNYNPKDSRTLEMLGYCRFREKRYAEALQAYNTAHQMVPDNAVVTYFVGVCHDALGNGQQAVDYYQQYLSSDDYDKKRRKYATRRIEAITRPPEDQVNWGEAIADVISAIQEEMEEN